MKRTRKYILAEQIIGFVTVAICAAFFISIANAQVRTVTRDINGWGINEPRVGSECVARGDVPDMWGSHRVEDGNRVVAYRGR